MDFAHLIESRKGQAWTVLIALAIVGMLIATMVWLSSRFNVEELYGILD
ncbi:MAG: hypothetical protein ACYDDS_20390 [Candidatus Sulfotelmatobacter sp.]|jgi:hypothetical protein